MITFMLTPDDVLGDMAEDAPDVMSGPRFRMGLR